MNNSKKNLFAAFLTASICSNSRLEAWFFDFDDLDEKIEQQFNQMRQSMRTMSKQVKHAFKNGNTPTRQLAITTKDGKLHITIPNIQGDIQAHLDDTQKKLTITAPEVKVIIATRLNMIGVELTEEHKVVEKDKEGDISFVSTAVSHMDQTTERELLLDQQRIEYDQDKKELTVIIPMKEEYKGKPVAINKINTKK